MTDLLAVALADYGALALWGVVYVSCLFMPIPTWAVLMLSGALVAGGILAPLAVAVAAVTGAVAGDQTGYWAGRRAGSLRARLAGRPRIGALVAAAEGRLLHNVSGTVFFTRWLVAPLGPYVNVAAGATGVGFWRFTLPALAGRGLWLGGYVALGWAFADRLEEAGARVGQIMGGLAVLAVLGVAGWLAVARWRVRRGQRRAAVSPASQSRNATSGG